jgi:ABC-type Zn uptake system ZnuABC Zn-binding protein ZnuA
LVTDHDALGYFADAYDFTIVGAVIPSLSTMAAPSASELAALQDQIEAEGVRAIFVSASVNPELAEQLAADTGATVAMIYTGSLSDAAGPASTYLDFMRYNMRTIMEALK